MIRTHQSSYVESHIESHIEGIISSYLYRDFPVLQKLIREHAEIYNSAVELMQEAPKGVEIVQIAADEAIESGMTQHSRKTLQDDYRLGLELGSDFVNELKDAN